MTTPVQLQFRRGTQSQMASFTGAAGETNVDTTNNRIVVQDGTIAGGWPRRGCSRSAAAFSINSRNATIWTCGSARHGRGCYRDDIGGLHGRRMDRVADWRERTAASGRAARHQEQPAGDSCLLRYRSDYQTADREPDGGRVLQPDSDGAGADLQRHRRLDHAKADREPPSAQDNYTSVRPLT